MIPKDGCKMKKVIQIVLLVVFLLFSVYSRGYSRNQPDDLKSFYSIFLSSDIGKTTRIVPIHYSLKPNDLQTIQTGKGIRLTLPGGLDYYYPLSPILPYIPLSIALDADESVSYIKTITNHMESQPLETISLARNPGLQSTNGESVDPSFVPCVTDSIFPSDTFSFSVVGDRSIKELSLKLFPIRLDRDKYYLSTQLELEIGIIQKKLDIIQSDSKEKAIILTPDELIEEAEKLKSIQEMDDYTVTVIPLSFIQKKHKPSDTASLKGISCFNDVSETYRKRFETYDYDTALQIRSYLKEAETNKTFQYITILGDASYIPPSDYIFSLYNKDSYDRAIPTDFFYMSPNAEDLDFPMEFSVGRIPVRSKSEAIHMVEKIRRYRKSFQPEWFNNVSLFGGDLFENDYYGELQNCFMIDENDFQGFKIQKFFQTDQLYNRETILKELAEANRGLLYINSHGRGDYLRLPKGYVDSSDIQKLPKKDTLPIFVSDACLNGAWDTRLSGIRYGTDKFFKYPTSFSEALLFSEGGAIAYVGGSRINYAGMDYDYSRGILESHRLYNTDALLHYVFQSYGTEETTLGDIARKGLMTYIQKDWDWPGDWLLKAVFGFCLLGDPTLRLPGKQKSSLTNIEFSELPTIREANSGELPSIQIEGTNQFQLESKTTSLLVHLSNYDSLDQAVLSTETILPQENKFFTYTLSNIPKARICLRIEAPDGSEKRFIAYGKYEQDLVLRPLDTFHSYSPDEKETFQFDVLNDGFRDASHVKVSVKKGNQALLDKEIPFLQRSVRYLISYNIDFAEQDTYMVQINCDPLPGEKSISDNTVTIKYRTEAKPGIKIGVFKSLYNVQDRSVYDKLWLDRINQYFEAQNIPAEVRLLSLDQCIHLDQQNLDKVVIYDSRYFQNNDEILSSLKKFTKSGGSVLVIGPTSKEVMKLCGIQVDDSFLMNQGDSSFQLFSILRSHRGKFTLPLFTLPCFESYAPEETDLLDSLDESAFLLGMSDDNMLYLVQNKNAFYFSGLLSGLDFERNGESLQFFIDLLLLNPKAS